MQIVRAQYITRRSKAREKQGRRRGSTLHCGETGNDRQISSPDGLQPLIHRKSSFLAFFINIIMQSAPRSPIRRLPPSPQPLHSSAEHEQPSHSDRGCKAEDQSAHQRTRKRKVIRKREGVVQRAMALARGPACPHVFNFLDLVSINERTLLDPAAEESYYRSMFYIRAVEKVELRKQALLVFTRSTGNVLPAQYIASRLRSYGNSSLHSLAATLEGTQQLFTGVDFGRQLLGQCELQPLARFIDAMGERIYMCKLAPNRLLISRRLLEMLGEDPELYGVRICKYRGPLDEIISGEKYPAVITKSVQNIGLLCAYLQGRLTLEELQQQALMEFDDYLYARERKTYCRFRLSMPSPLVSCLEVHRQLAEPVDTRLPAPHKPTLQKEITAHRYSETAVLKHLMTLPDNLLGDHRERTAGYSCIQ